jgi:hypothetical protein
LDFFANYWVIAMDQNGLEHFACPFTPSIMSLRANVKSYPNPVKSTNTVITVKAEVNRLSDLEGATIAVISPLGIVLEVIKVTDFETFVTLPNVPGAYILQFRSNVINKEIKTIVVE